MFVFVCRRRIAQLICTRPVGFGTGNRRPFSYAFLCCKMSMSGQNERIERELDVSIFGIGISVVNNSPNCNSELVYTSISSSDIVWEIRR